MKLLLVALTLASGLLFNAFRTTEDKKVYEYTRFLIQDDYAGGPEIIYYTDSTGAPRQKSIFTYKSKSGKPVRESLHEYYKSHDEVLNEYGRAGWRIDAILREVDQSKVTYIMIREKR